MNIKRSEHFIFLFFGPKSLKTSHTLHLQDISIQTSYWSGTQWPHEAGGYWIDLGIDYELFE